MNIKCPVCSYDYDVAEGKYREVLKSLHENLITVKLFGCKVCETELKNNIQFLKTHKKLLKETV